MAETDKSQLVNMAFAGGIDERARPELVDATQSFLVLQNTRQVSAGSYTTRKGFTSLGIPGGGARRVFQFGDSVATVSGIDGIFSYSETGQAWCDIAQESGDSADVTRHPLLRTEGLNIATADMAIANGFAVVTWCAVDVDGPPVYRYSVYYAVYDTATWSCVVPPRLLNYTSYAFSVQTKIVDFGNYACVVLYHGSSSRLDMLSLDCTSNASIATGWSTIQVGSDCPSNTSYDVTSNTTGVYVAYGNNTSGTARITAVLLNGVGVVGTVTVTTASSAIGAIGIGCDSSSVWVSWANAGNVYSVAYNTNLSVIGTSAAVLTTVAADAVGCAVASGAAHISASYANNYVNKVSASVVAGAVVAGIVSKSYNASYATRPFLVGVTEVPYAVAWVANASGTSMATQCLVRIEPNSAGYLMPAANIAPRLCRDSAGGAFQHVSTVSANKFACLVATTKNQASDGLEVVTFEFNQKHLFQSANIADGAYMSGGILTLFDGSRWMEPNSVNRPDKPTGAASGVGGSLTFTAGARYIAVYERVDATGNVHWSALSDPSNLVTFASQQFANVTVSTLTISQCSFTTIGGGRWRVAVYRTTGEATTGTTYYRAGTIANLTTAATVTFADFMTDAVLITQPQLYRQNSVIGAPQNRELPPALRYLTSHGDRLVGVGSDGISVWYSAKHVLGEGMWFSSLFQFPVEQGGPITGLASQDGRLYIFKRSNIFVVDGDGPSENGANGDYSLPTRLPTGLGCIDANSIVVTPVGTFFQSDRGIELLSRSLDVAWAGEQVSNTLAAYPVVSSAVVSPTDSTVLFTCITSGGAEDPYTTGITLVYDYAINKWVSVDKFVYSRSFARSACVATIGGTSRYHHMEPAGGVFRQSDDHLDIGSYVEAVIETGWFRGAQQGEQDVVSAVLLASRDSNHDLEMKAAYNYVDTYTQTRTWTAAQLYNAVNTREQVEMLGDSNKRCQAVKYRFTTAAPTDPGTYPVGTGQGATFIALTIEVQPRAGRVKLPATSR